MAIPERRRPAAIDNVSPDSLPSDVENWLSEAAKLADRFRLDTISASLYRLRVQSMRAGWRICVTGVSGTETARLVSQLTGMGLPPAGSPGERDIQFAGAPGDDSADAGLPDSDAVIVVTRAPTAFGLAEQQFLSERVLPGRPASSILVVVTGLDDAQDGQDAQDVLTRVRRLAAGISPGIEVLPGPGADPSAPASAVRLEAIRATVRRFTSEAGRDAIRARHIAALVAVECAAMVRVAGEGITAASLDQEQRRQAQDRLESAIASDDLTWEHIRTELDQRRLTLAKTLRNRLEEGRAQLVSTLLLQLSEHPDPAAFWDKQLPLILGRELSAAAAAHTGYLEAQVNRDAAWLDATATHAFGPAAGPGQALPDDVAGSRSAARPDAGGPPPVRLPPLELSDARRAASRMQLVSRLGLALASTAFANAFGLPQFAMLGLAGGSAVGDKMHQTWLESERDKVRGPLRKAVDESIDARIQAVLDLTRTEYAELIGSARARQRSWQAASRRALADPAGAPLPWAELRDQATALHQRISAAADGSPPAGPAAGHVQASDPRPEA